MITRLSNVLMILSLTIALLWIFAFSALASNYAQIGVTCNVEPILELWVGGQTGTTKGPEIGFSGVGMYSTMNVADYYTDLSYMSNVASWKIEVANVSTGNATYMDGLMRWNDVVNVVPLYVYIMPIFDGIKNNPTLTDSGWKPVWDSQRPNTTGALRDLLVGTGEVYDLTHKEIYYRANFANAAAGNYYAVIQYQLSVQ